MADKHDIMCTCGHLGANHTYCKWDGYYGCCNEDDCECDEFEDSTV